MQHHVLSPRSVYIGYDPREQAAYAVAKQTANCYGRSVSYVGPVVLDALIDKGMYSRKTEYTEAGHMFDVVSNAPMSTEFAISRFLVPQLAQRRTKQSRPLGWALFMDCDVMVRSPLEELFEQVEREPSKALFCVQHKHEPTNTEKMDKQLQTLYARKNWSSVMLFNLDHPANKILTIEFVNILPGRDLHRFCWLQDEQIGALNPKWNYLVGYSPELTDPAIVHWTNGGPWFPAYRNAPFAGEWRNCLLNGTF